MFAVSVVLDSTSLTPLQQRAAFRLVGYEKKPADDKVLSANAVFGIWIFMLVGRLKFLEPEQQTLLAEAVVKDLHTMGDLLDHSEPFFKRNKAPILIIGEGRYATWYNRTGWLDLANGESVQEPPVPPLEIMSYNLETLFRRNKAACETILRKGQNAATANTRENP